MNRRINPTFPPEILAEIRRLAKEHRRSLSNMIIVLIEEALATRKQNRSITESLEDWEDRAKREGRIK